MRARALLLPLSVAALLTGCEPKSGSDGAGTDAGGGAGATNAAPTVAIISHNPGDTEREGYPFSLMARVDDDGGLTGLSVTWKVGGVEVCAPTTPSDDGTAACDVDLGVGAADVEVVVVDAEGAEAGDAVRIEVLATDAPTASISSPEGNGRFYADLPVQLAAVVADAEDAPTDLQVRWWSELARDAPFALTIATDGTVSGEASLAEGLHTLVLQVTDGSGKTAQSSVVIEVGAANSAPLCAITAPVDGAVVLAGEAVELVGGAVDADQPSPELALRWESDVDGVLSAAPAGEDGSTGLSTTALSAGAHTLTLRAEDERGAACAASLGLTIGLAPTASITSPMAGDPADEGLPVTFTAQVGDPDGAAEALALRWTLADGTVLDSAGADADGVASFSTAGLAPGAHTVRLTATDAHGFSASAEIDVEVNGRPSAPTVSIGPVGAGAADELSVAIDAEAVDPEGDALTYQYAWSVDGAPSGASSGPTLPAGAAVRGQVWTVDVTAHDGRISGPAGSAAITIANTAPTASSATLSPALPTVTDALACAGVGEDIDGDTVSFAVAWTVDGALQAETGPTLAAGLARAGQVVGCEVTPFDGVESGAPVASATVTVQNTAPTATSVEITPAAPRTGEDLSCAAVGDDVDGDTVSFAYSWTVNGVAAGAGPVLPAASTARGDVIGCSATPHDGAASGDALEATAVSVVNSAPALTGITLTPSAPTAAGDVTCAATAEDADGDAVSISYGWTINGVDAGISADVLPQGAFVRGDQLACTATPSDGSEAGAADSRATTVGNAVPVVSFASISPGAPATDGVISGSVSGIDADGDSLAASWDWYVNGVAVVTGGGSSLSGASFDRDDVVFAVVTVNDGDDDSAPFTTAPVTVANTAPTAPEVVMAPVWAEEGDSLICEIDVEATDLDGDTLAYAFTWTRDGVPWTGDVATTTHAGDTIDGADVFGDEVWACEAVATDGDLTSPAAGADVQILPTSRTYEIDIAELFDVGFECAGSQGDDTLRYSITGDVGFRWTDVDMRTPVSVTIDFGWGMDCGGFMGDIERQAFVNGAGLTTIVINPMACTCWSDDTLDAFTVSAGTDPVNYVVGGVNEVSFDLSAGWDLGVGFARRADLDGLYARVSVEY
jgi:hypothetical protein